MKKRILITGLACVLAFNAVSCGKKSKSTTKETETTTEDIEYPTDPRYTGRPLIADDDALTFYNAIDGSESGEHLEPDNTEAILKVLNPIKDEKNLIDKYKKSDEQKIHIPLLKLRTDDGYISYIGEDKWVFEDDENVSIYQANGDNATLPFAYLATCVAVPYAFAESNYDKYAGNYQEEYYSFSHHYKEDILKQMDVDISNISDKSVAISPDFDTPVENIFVYKNENKYIRYICTKDLTDKTAANYYIERSDMDKSNDPPEIEYAYSFMRYKNKAFGRDGQNTKWYAIDKRDDDIIKN